MIREECSTLSTLLDKSTKLFNLANRLELKGNYIEIDSDNLILGINLGCGIYMNIYFSGDDIEYSLFDVMHGYYSIARIYPNDIDTLLNDIPEFIDRFEGVMITGLITEPSRIETIVFHDFLLEHGIDFEDYLNYIFCDIEYNISEMGISMSYKSLYFAIGFRQKIIYDRYQHMILDLREHMFSVEKMREHKLKNLCNFD
jgi:hypothetical protein